MAWIKSPVSTGSSIGTARSERGIEEFMSNGDSGWKRKWVDAVGRARDYMGKNPRKTILVSTALGVLAAGALVGGFIRCRR